MADQSILDLTEYVEKSVTDMTVPKGRYVGDVTSASEITTDYGTSYVVSVDLDTRLDDAGGAAVMTSASGAADVRTVVDWMPTKGKDGKASKAVFRVVAFMRAIGIDVRAGGVVQVALNSWVGERVGIAVDYEEYAGKMRQRLTPFAAPAIAVSSPAGAMSAPPVPPAVPSAPVPPPVAPPTSAPAVDAAQAPQVPSAPVVAEAALPTADDVVAQLRAQQQS